MGKRQTYSEEYKQNAVEIIKAGKAYRQWQGI
jgi:hypothetical protein